uniref:Uncharacterized protein n=1 Tax=Hyaloperonospora arabidopsidis (strain Emoy2) TaxID=559515 RepID=M4BG85_HYAAE
MTTTFEGPTQVPRITPAPTTTSSHSLALSANKNKNWRANYLRALNIVTPDVTTWTRGRHVSATDTYRRPTANQLTGSGRSELLTTSRRRIVAGAEEGTRRSSSGNSSSCSSCSSSSNHHSTRGRSISTSKSRRGASPGDTDKTSMYVFGLRSHLFRARRATNRSDYGAVRGCSGKSAPIKIPKSVEVASPTATVSSPFEDESNRAVECLQVQRRPFSTRDYPNPAAEPKSSTVQLLSWEESLAMRGQREWLLERENRNSSNEVVEIPVDCRWSSRRPDGIVEECEETEEEDLDGCTQSEDDDEGIFKMEFDSGSTGGKVISVNKRANKERERVNVSQRRPSCLNDAGGTDENEVVTPLSASFVPPHQMVEHGCFSLGLRDKLKRKPGVYC